MAGTSVKRVNLPAYSMFRNTPVYDVDGTVVMGLMQQVAFRGPGDVIHTVTMPDANRLDKISGIYYGIPDLWWAIAQVNNIVDVFAEISIGTKLIIPNRSRLPTTG